MGCNLWGNTFHPARWGATYGVQPMGGVFREHILPQPQGCNLWGGGVREYILPRPQWCNLWGAREHILPRPQGCNLWGARGVAPPRGALNLVCFPNSASPSRRSWVGLGRSGWVGLGACLVPAVRCALCAGWVGGCRFVFPAVCTTRGYAGILQQGSLTPSLLLSSDYSGVRPRAGTATGGQTTCDHPHQPGPLNVK